MNWLLAALQWVFRTPPVQWALGALMLLGVLKARDRQQRHKGREEALQQLARADVEAAAEIHRRAAAARDAGGMPVDPAAPADTRGYRD